MVSNRQEDYEISMLPLHGRGVIPFPKPSLPLLGYPVLQSDTEAEYTDIRNRMVSLIGI
jgi:hypothetical protein